VERIREVDKIEDEVKKEGAKRCNEEIRKRMIKREKEDNEKWMAEINVGRKEKELPLAIKIGRNGPTYESKVEKIEKPREPRSASKEFGKEVKYAPMEETVHNNVPYVPDVIVKVNGNQLLTKDEKYKIWLGDN
jgi:hypothetical protein